MLNTDYTEPKQDCSTLILTTCSKLKSAYQLDVYLQFKIINLTHDRGTQKSTAQQVLKATVIKDL